MSNLINAMRDAIKSETELYTMRIQQQMNRYCSVIENAVSVTGGARDNYQEQIDALKAAVDSIVVDLYKYKCSSICSSDLDNEIDILPEPNLVVNKVKPEEIKEVHINFDKGDDVKSSISSVNGSDSPREIVVVNEAVEEENTNDNAGDDIVEAEEEVAGEEVIKEAVDEAIEEEIVEDEIVEEEEGVELEQIEWKGVKYYKDADDNVYECLEDDEVGEAIGTMSKKIAGKVLLYAVE